MHGCELFVRKRRGAHNKMERKLVGMNFHAPMIPMDTVVKFKLDTGEDYESTVRLRLQY